MLFFWLFLVGCAAGRLASVWACLLLVPIPAGMLFCPFCHQRYSRFGTVFHIGPRRCSGCGKSDVRWPWLAMILTGLLAAGFSWLLISYNCQSVDEVIPSGDIRFGRLPFQLFFMFLLVVVTITDLLDYAIPDLVILVGVVSAVVWASLSGELQMIHVWVNWDDALPGIRGPYLPAWMDQHRHLHGFVWSMVGLISGAGLMWMLRTSATMVLGVPAVGLGDVTLMAMIGSFMGWQPTLCVLAVAPMVGLLVGVVIRFATGRNFVAFGPYLAVSAVVVLCTWGQLWQQWSLRTIFSHWPSVAAIVAGSLVALNILLLAVRGFRALPTSAMKR